MTPSSRVFSLYSSEDYGGPVDVLLLVRPRLIPLQIGTDEIETFLVSGKGRTGRHGDGLFVSTLGYSQSWSVEGTSETLLASLCVDMWANEFRFVKFAKKMFH